MAIRMGAATRDYFLKSVPRVAADRLGWLKWREFGRRGDTARDQVIRVLSELLSVAPCLPVGTRIPKQASLPTDRPTHPLGLVCFVRGGGRREGASNTSRIRPLIGKDYPLSLSISLSGGKEINEDCLSSGERSGKSSIRIGYPRWLNCNLKVRAKGKIEA